VHVLQGERQFARDNRTLGRFQLVGIPPAPRGVPQIEVTFDIDANGIVNVSAKDMGTGKEQKITITASSGLSKDEVDRMMKDADAHAEEDRKRREEVEARNRADQAVYAAEKLLQESGDKVGEADRAAVQSAIESVKSAMNANDAAAMNQAMEALTQAQHKLAEALYRQQAPGGAAGAAPGGAAPSNSGDAAGPAQGDVIDAAVVDENKSVLAGLTRWTCT
jgi:molecular chaperone DnaK